MDFYGFWFNGHHSSEFGIVRVSNGSRYQSNLVPAFQDKTVAVPGGDGTYFFSSNYTNRTFSINFATDSMTEFQYRVFRHHFNGKDTGPLIFDEEPYKVYTAKIQAPPQFNFLCFDEEVNGTKQRVYKGEGTIQFICYYPYARSYYKFLDQYVNTEDDPEGTPSWNNINEWKNATTMLDSQGDYDGHNSSVIKLYNAGDIEADPTIWIPIRTGNTTSMRVNTYNQVYGAYMFPIEDDLTRKEVQSIPKLKILYIPTGQTALEEVMARAKQSPSTLYSCPKFIFCYAEEYEVDQQDQILNGKLYYTQLNGIRYNSSQSCFELTAHLGRTWAQFSDTNIESNPKIKDGGTFEYEGITILSLTSSYGNETNPVLCLSEPEDNKQYVYLSIDSKTNLVNYCDINKAPVRTANDLITAGDFFKLPPGFSVLSTNDDSKKIEQVQYDYLFY